MADKLHEEITVMVSSASAQKNEKMYKGEVKP